MYKLFETNINPFCVLNSKITQKLLTKLKLQFVILLIPFLYYSLHLMTYLKLYLEARFPYT
jgi:hypothetical protein